MTALNPAPISTSPEPYEDIPNAAEAGQARAATVGAEFKHRAMDYLGQAGAQVVRGPHKVGSYNVEAVVCGTNGQRFLVLAHGVLDDDDRAGLKRTDTLKKAGFDAVMIRRLRDLPILLVTSHLPDKGAAAAQLADCAGFIFDVIATYDDFAGYQRLQRYLHEEPFPGQLDASWRDNPSQWTPELFDGPDQQVQAQHRYTPCEDDVDEAEPL